MVGTYRRVLANPQETPYPRATPGLGCCFPNYGPKGLLARQAVEGGFVKAMELTTGNGTANDGNEMGKKTTVLISPLLPLYLGELWF